VRDHDIDYAMGISKLVGGNIRFSSTAQPGLELVDVLTNAVRRAVTGKLQPEGYEHLPSLMVHRSSHYISVVSMAGEQKQTVSYASVLRHFRHGGKSMVVA
jgi:hypothetical protein